MKISDMPLGQLPFAAVNRFLNLKESKFCEVTGRYKQIPICSDSFKPTNISDDLSTGEPTALVFWYPEYIDFLTDLAVNKEGFEDFLGGYNISNIAWFKDIFSEMYEHLVKLETTDVAFNDLNEAVITKGNLKL